MYDAGSSEPGISVTGTVGTIYIAWDAPANQGSMRRNRKRHLSFP